MTIAEVKPLVRLLTLKQLREYAAIGLNIEMNGMRQEDWSEFVLKLKSQKKNKHIKEST